MSRPSGKGTQVSEQTTNRYFDDLARAMADGSLSRRRALKLFAGSAIAALIPSRALADDDDCVRVCHVPFDRETEECDFANAETRCVSRSRRRFHLENHPCDCRGRCANCLTMCLPNGDTCSANNQCCSGRCVGGTCAEPCPAGRVLLSNGTCALPCSASCPECGAGLPSCVQETVSGTAFCRGAVFGACDTTNDCPPGQFCGGDGSGLCLTAC